MADLTNNDILRAEDFDPPLTPKQMSQVQEVINEAIRRNQAPTPVKEPKRDLQPPLKHYRQFEKVSVMRNGDWLEGTISTIDKVSFNLHVDTERGPVTIASPRLVRKLA